MNEPLSEDRIAEYQRRANLWNATNAAAREAAKKVLGEVEFAQIDALATANHMQKSVGLIIHRHGLFPAFLFLVQCEIQQ